MYFSEKQIQSQHPNIYVGGQMIKNAEEFKYPRVILDSFLTFKKHIQKTCLVLKYKIANFWHIRKSLSTEAAKSYLNAMILSHYNIMVPGKRNWFKSSKIFFRIKLWKS